METYHIQLTLVTVFISLGLFVGVESQVFPYISFMGTILPNNSVVDSDVVGNAADGGNSLQCHTDAALCCSIGHRAWYLPNGTKLFSVDERDTSAFEVVALAQRFDLRLNDPTAARNIEALSGIYECAIGTEAGSQSVYVGVYPEPSGNSIAADLEQALLTVDSDLNGDSPQFTLTCTSTTRPPATVQWFRNGQEIVDTDNSTVLDDPLTARYTHTLTVTGRLGGEYMCLATVYNDLSSASATIGVLVGSPPTGVSAFQAGPTSVHVFWGHPDPEGDTIGYRIYYTGPTSGSMDADDIDFNNHVITGLVNGGTYSFSVAGKSEDLPSERVMADQGLIRLVPGVPELTLTSTTSDSISFSWTVPSGSVVERYELVWEIRGQQQATLQDTVSNTTHSFTIARLKEYDNATVQIMVTAVNEVGTAGSNLLNVHTDSLSRDGSTESEDYSIGAIIGGAVGVFLTGALTGVVIVIVTIKVIQKCRKISVKSEQHLPTSHNGAEVSAASYIPRNSTADPPTTQNLAYQTDVFYDYID